MLMFAGASLRSSAGRNVCFVLTQRFPSWTQIISYHFSPNDHILIISETSDVLTSAWKNTTPVAKCFTLGIFQGVYLHCG